MADADAKIVDPSGRELGPRALQTRRRLLEATAALLDQRPLARLSVVEIARKAGTSSASFYQYFREVSDAALALARQAAEEIPAVVARLEGPWRGRQGLDTARALVDAFLRHWDAHRAVLLVRNLASDQGDARFKGVRREALNPLQERLAARVAEGVAEGRIARGMHPEAAAAALVSLLERLGAHGRGISVTREDLVETAARMVYQTVTGRSAPG